jgi:FkbM family methyltransferase
MISKLKYHVKIFLQGFVEEWKKRTWDNSSKNSFNLIVLENHAFEFVKWGEITKILYSRQHLLSQRKSFEYDTLTKYSKLIKKGDTVLDIGANVGIFSLLGAKLVGNKGKVYAFEPSRLTFEALNKNIELNKIQNVFTQKLALSNTEGSIKMGDSENDALNFIDVKNVNNEGETVEMKTLDNWLDINKLHVVNFIKIDIEGAEFLCFKGATRMLKNMQPTIIMECNEKWCNRFDYTVFDLLNFLNGFGYTFEQYEEAQWICYPPNYSKL